jgi:hypothetical protein
VNFLFFEGMADRNVWQNSLVLYFCLPFFKNRREHKIFVTSYIIGRSGDLRLYKTAREINPLAANQFTLRQKGQ